MTNVDIQQVLERPLVVTSHARGHGPRVALRTWLSGRRSVAETAEWLEDARLEAILGSCRRSLPSVRCVGCYLSWRACVSVSCVLRAGITCYLEFVKSVKGGGVAAFPPKVEWIQAWGTMFRCSGTFANYLGYAKIGCLLAKVDTTVFQHPAVRRAKDSVAKSGRFASREKLWIRRHRIEALMRWAEVCPCGRISAKVCVVWCYGRKIPRRSASQLCIWSATSSC